MWFGIRKIRTSISKQPINKQGILKKRLFDISDFIFWKIVMVFAKSLHSLLVSLCNFRFLSLKDLSNKFWKRKRETNEEEREEETIALEQESFNLYLPFFTLQRSYHSFSSSSHLLSVA